MTRRNGIFALALAVFCYAGGPAAFLHEVIEHGHPGQAGGSGQVARATACHGHSHGLAHAHAHAGGGHDHGPHAPGQREQTPGNSRGDRDGCHTCDLLTGITATAPAGSAALAIATPTPHHCLPIGCDPVSQVPPREIAPRGPPTFPAA